MSFKKIFQIQKCVSHDEKKGKNPSWQSLYVTRSHKMVDKSHFDTIELFIYSERRENADYCGEKMIVVSAKIKKLW